MIPCEIDCIQKTEPNGPHESITHIGCRVGRWRLTVAAAIYRIEKNTHAFYVLNVETGVRTPIGVVREFGKPPYLRSYAKGHWTDELLTLVKCSAHCSLIG